MNTIGGKLCAWDGSACADPSGPTVCTDITGIGLTHEYCRVIDVGCSVNVAQTSCI